MDNALVLWYTTNSMDQDNSGYFNVISLIDLKQIWLQNS
jgi:hypothetical protein